MSTDIIAARPDPADKSLLTAWLFWLFLGFTGAHRFYLNKFGTGVTMAVLAFNAGMWVLVWVGHILLAILGIWLLVDAFLIPGWVRQANNWRGRGDSNARPTA